MYKLSEEENMLMAELGKVFSNRGDALKWLNERHPLMKNRTPKETIEEFGAEGYKVVMGAIAAIDLRIVPRKGLQNTPEEKPVAPEDIPKKISMYFMQALTEKTYYLRFCKALSFVRPFAQGGIWCIGGMVFRPIVWRLYHAPNPPLPFTDYDFLVGEFVPQVTPEGWRRKKTRYGSPKFTDGEIDVSIIPLANVHSIARRGLPCTMENYLTGTPLNIQSLLFDVGEWCAGNKVFVRGDIGIGAIQQKIVAVNDIAQLRHYAQTTKKSIDRVILEKADGLGLLALLPPVV